MIYELGRHNNITVNETRCDGFPESPVINHSLHCAPSSRDIHKVVQNKRDKKDATCLRAICLQNNLVLYVLLKNKKYSFLRKIA